MDFDAEGFARRVAGVLPKARPIPLHDPWLGYRERAEVAACIAGGWVSGNGPYVEKFERMLGDRLGAPHVIATVTGTAALHIALLCAGIRPGDEVMLPALAFVATANAIRYCGATPYFVDSDERLGACPESVSRAIWKPERRVRAVVQVHVLGHAGSHLTPSLRQQVHLIEDAAEALGSRDEVGVIPRGYFGVLSFNGNKTITTGQGGAFITCDAEIAKRARHLANTAKLPHAWQYEHDEVGFNYRMPDLNAALGIAQLERLDDILAAKRTLAERYRDALADMPGVEFVSEPPGCRSNYWLSAALVPDAEARDAALAALHADGLLARPAWKLLCDLPMYRDSPRSDLSEARDLADRLVCLPSGCSAAG